LPGFIAAHVARYRATQRVSILTTPERRLFLEDLARRFGQTGTVTLTILKIETRPVAWSYGFQFEGSWFLYQTTFDTRDEDNSPGYCILGKILMEACDNTELQRVDMGLGEEGYKAWFANSTRQTVHATLTRSLSGHLKNVARYRTASLLKRSPQVESTVRALLQPFRSRRDKT
jgi:CelD/BcsL family acetyltransferase involved in cellulose biosynthesis